MERNFWVALCMLLIIVPFVQIAQQGFENTEALWGRLAVGVLGVAGILLRNIVVPKVKIKSTFAVIGLMVVLTTSCTDNQRARKFGGTETVYLEPTEKFINITWKEDDLWIVVQDTVTGIYYAREKSSLGFANGKVIIRKK